VGYDSGMNERPRRSLLYVPASSEAMLRKAGTRDADVLIVDLEDGVLPEAKDAARETLVRIWKELDFGPSEALVRVNPLGVPWHNDDLQAVSRLRPAGVVLPKSEELALVEFAARALEGVPLLLMIETARGVAAAAELASAPGVAAILFGGADYRASVRARRAADESEILVARASLVLAARAAGIEVFDTPYFDYRDPDGLEASARRARSLGFDGKTAVHPGQVPVLNRVFAPTEDEVDRARRIVAALDEAAARGQGVATVDGEMVETLHAREARRTLAADAAARARRS
jgi:citrate lyase subunit beta/citryl-CoA lyase